MKAGKQLIKVSTYLYLHELYEGKTKRKSCCEFDWTSFSSAKFGSNPSPSTDPSEKNYILPQKDKNLMIDHFWLKKLQDQEHYKLVPFNSQTK